MTGIITHHFTRLYVRAGIITHLFTRLYMRAAIITVGQIICEVWYYYCLTIIPDFTYNLANRVIIPALTYNLANNNTSPHI
jgi:hypothetical protein